MPASQQVAVAAEVAAVLASQQVVAATSFIDGKTVLHTPTPSLPDETLLDAVALSTRLRNVFKYNDLKTVGDVREASDATLRSFQDFGRGSLVYIRETFGRSQGR